MGCLYKIGYWSWVSIYYAFGVSLLVAFFNEFGASWDADVEISAEAWFPYFCTIYWSLANFIGPFNQRGRMKKSLILFFFGFVFIIPLLKTPALSPVFAYVVLTLFPFILFLYYSYLDARMAAKIKSLEKLKKRAQEQKMREKHRMAKKNEEEKGKGIGDELVINSVKNIPEEEIKISAQSYLKGFYGKHGFVAKGKEYLEDGIPHTAMFLRQ